MNQCPRGSCNQGRSCNCGGDREAAWFCLGVLLAVLAFVMGVSAYLAWRVV